MIGVVTSLAATGLYEYWPAIGRFVTNVPWLDFGGGPLPEDESVVPFDDAVVALMRRFPAEQQHVVRGAMVSALQASGYYELMRERGAFERWSRGGDSQSAAEGSM